MYRAGLVTADAVLCSAYGAARSAPFSNRPTPGHPPTSPCPQNDSYPTTQLPYFWTAAAEILNGRAAMIGLVGLLVNELVRGAALF